MWRVIDFFLFWENSAMFLEARQAILVVGWTTLEGPGLKALAGHRRGRRTVVLSSCSRSWRSLSLVMVPMERKASGFFLLFSNHLAASSKDADSLLLGDVPNIQGWVKTSNRPGKKLGQLYLKLFPNLWTNNSKCVRRKLWTLIKWKLMLNKNFF